ncbi:MAG: hypothetical protein QXU98_13085 [Candidatus Parvarchaeota archaeon]
MNDPQSPEDLKENQKDNDMPNDGFGFDYYRITSSFEYQLEKTVKRSGFCAKRAKSENSVTESQFSTDLM